MASWDTNIPTTPTQNNAPAQGEAWDSWGSPAAPATSAKKKRGKKKLLKRSLIALVPVVLIGTYFGVIVPPAKSLPEAAKGTSTFVPYMTALHDFDTDGLNSVIEQSWVAREYDYLNGNEARTNAVKAILATVTYQLPETGQLTWTGQPHRNPFTWKPTTAPSTLNNGENVDFQLVDYGAVTLDKTGVKDALAKAKLTSISDVEFSRKVTDAFATYIAANAANLPTTTISRPPVMDCTGTGLGSSCRLSSAEDVYMDDTLFASDSFRKLQDTFSELAVDALDPEHATATTREGDSEDAKTTRKYADSYYTEPNWIGAHALTSAGQDGSLPDTSALPRVGDGTFNAPAGLNTPVVVKTTDGTDTPIEVTLSAFLTGPDAFRAMSQKSAQNRGFVESSEVQYAFYTFKVRNLGTETITLTPDDTLVDATRNPYTRTGTVYGLTNSVTLAPGESGTLESWTSSTRLSELYLIWGASYDRSTNPIWFRVLAGNPSSGK